MTTLIQVHQASNPQGPELIFVHGLYGHCKSTWMSNPEDQTTLWPQWIGEDTGCNVWVADYDASPSDVLSHSMHLVDLGKALFACLASKNELADKSLVLIGHSLGGLVIKSGLITSATIGDPFLSSVGGRVISIVFAATPHQGSPLADVAERLRKVVRGSRPVQAMRKDDPWLRLINAQFRHLVDKNQIMARVFFETQPIVRFRLFGWNLSKGLLVVDADSSDPGLSNVDPIPIDRNHIEIVKPRLREELIHNALLDFITRPTKQLEEPGLEPPKPAVERLDVDQVTRILNKASKPLIEWPHTLPDGTWIEREELEEIEQYLSAQSGGTYLILGEPGCGKSSLLSKLALEKQNSGWVVLAIRADRLDSSIRDRDSLQRHLGIDSCALETIKTLALERQVLVAIDQLDALADLVVQSSARLRVLLDFIQDLAGQKNVSIVLSCREFEQKHDPALRNIDAQVITLELPEWKEIESLFQNAGITTSGWSEEIKNVLRSPHALNIFLRIHTSSAPQNSLTSFHGLLEELWKTKVLSDSSGRLKGAAHRIAAIMAEREELSLALAVIDDMHEQIRELTSEGILRELSPLGTVEFTHQTYYEFVRARSFLEESNSLTNAVLSKQDNLRIRPQLWHALTYMRSVSLKGYTRELRLLWAADIRTHLRTLVIDFLANQPSPTPYECELVDKEIEGEQFLKHFLAASAGSAGWFDFLTAKHITRWMTATDGPHQILELYLRRAMAIDSTKVVSLVSRYWLPNQSNDIQSWQILTGGPTAPLRGIWLDSLVQIAGRTRLSGWAIEDAMLLVSKTLPNDAVYLLEAWLKLELDQILNTSPSRELRSAREILHPSNMYQLATVALAAPSSFVLTLWPTLEAAFAHYSRSEYGARETYLNYSGIFQARDTDYDASTSDGELMTALVLAIKAWASLDPHAFHTFAEEQFDSDLIIVHRLVAIGLAETAPTHSSAIIRYLINDPRRLMLGPYDNVHQESMALITAASENSDQESLMLIFNTISVYSPYKPSKLEESDAKTRFDRMRWSREHRLRLFKAIPIGKLPDDAQKFLTTEERAFPELEEVDIRFSGVHAIGSPVSSEQMRLSSDSNILNLFAELTDEHSWDHPRLALQGGAIQAGRALADLASLDIEKCLRIIRKLKPGINEIPVGSTLGSLSSAGVPPQDLFDLILELDEAGFCSIGFRANAAGAAAKATSKENLIPAKLLTCFERWLSETKSAGSSNSDSDEIIFDDSAREDQTTAPSSLLWNGDTIKALPSGNYPVLTAITYGYLLSSPPKVEEWLVALETHVNRPEDPAVWEALLSDELRHLKMAGQDRYMLLINRLISRHPGLLASPDWITFLSQVTKEMTPDTFQEFIELTLEQAEDPLGAGELLGLRYGFFPEEHWVRERVEAALKGDNVRLTTGIANSVFHLWLEPLFRPVMHTFLTSLVRTAEPSILNGISTIFSCTELTLDQETLELLQLITEHPQLLSNPGAENLPELVSDIVKFEPLLAFKLASTILDEAGGKISSFETSWYLHGEWLLDIALQLQDMTGEHPKNGARLFERLLEHNTPNIASFTSDFDMRMPDNGRAFESAPRRKRRRRTRRKRSDALKNS